MMLRALVLLLIAQTACVGWRWWPRATPAAAVIEHPSRPADSPADAAPLSAMLAALRAFESDWDAGRSEPFPLAPPPLFAPLRPSRNAASRPAGTFATGALKDDAVARGEWHQKRFALRKDLAAFFIEADMPPAQSRRILDLLADFECGTRFAQLAANAANTPQLGTVLRNDLTKDLDEALHAVVGEAGAAQLDRYRATLPVRRDRDLFVAELRGLNLEPPALVQKRLLAILVEGQAGADGMYHRDSVLQNAARVLSPAQLAALDDLIRRRSGPPEAPTP